MHPHPHARCHIGNIDSTKNPTQTDSSLVFRFHSPIESHRFHSIVLIEVSTSCINTWLQAQCTSGLEPCPVQWFLQLHKRYPYSSILGEENDLKATDSNWSCSNSVASEFREFQIRQESWTNEKIIRKVSIISKKIKHNSDLTSIVVFFEALESL